MVEHVVKHHFDVSYMGEPAELIYQEGEVCIQIGTEADGFVMVDIDRLRAVVNTISEMTMKEYTDG